METFDEWLVRQNPGCIHGPDAFIRVAGRYQLDESGVQIVTKMIALGWNPLIRDQPQLQLVVAQVFPEPRATMQLLINLGVDVNNDFGFVSPLNWTIGHDLYENAEHLMMAGAKIRRVRGDFSSSDPLHARRIKELQQFYRGMGHCRAAQRAAARALAKMNRALRDVATHVIAPLIWETRGSEEWSCLK